MKCHGSIRSYDCDVVKTWIIRGAEAPYPEIHQRYNHEVKIHLKDGVKEFIPDMSEASEQEVKV